MTADFCVWVLILSALLLELPEFSRINTQKKKKVGGKEEE